MKFLKWSLRIACIGVVLYASSMYADAGSGAVRLAWLLAEVGAFMAMVMSATTEHKSRY